MGDREFVPLAFGMLGEGVRMETGLRQGSPEAGLLFAAVLSKIMHNLSIKWKAEGYGFYLGPLGGDPEATARWHRMYETHFRGYNLDDLYLAILGFVDDLYLLANSTCEAALMVADLRSELLKVGLEIQREKLRWIANKHVIEDVLHLGEFSLARSDTLTALGSIVSGHGQENKTYEHRITQSWKVYHKWKHMFACKSTCLAAKLYFWCKAVGMSMLWGLETTRKNTCLSKRLHTTQCLQVCKMIGIKRIIKDGQVESWIEFSKRKFKTASTIITEHEIDIRNLLNDKINSWNLHIARFGTIFDQVERPMRFLKLLLLWRRISWWRMQQACVDSSGNHFRHAGKLKPSRWEDQLPKEWIFEQQCYRLT